MIRNDKDSLDAKITGEQKIVIKSTGTGHVTETYQLVFAGYKKHLPDLPNVISNNGDISRCC